MPQTGATRYQKFLKSEKAKTKLKAKKDLPKGTNITKTNFKVKKIVIKEQLKKHLSSEILSKRKLSIKELISRLGHFNVHTRTEALDGLKELITNHPDVIEQSLGQIIHGVSPLLLNIEKSVRRESLTVIHLILTNVSSNKIGPFFEVMCTYLRSAMTHIDSRVQEGSLLFLDILLSCLPEYMIEYFHKIMPNFLDMISKLRTDSKPGRVLTVNLTSQTTSIKWRVQVLQRLGIFLSKYTEYNNKTDKTVGPKTEIKTIFDSSKVNRFNLSNNIHTSVAYLPCFSSSKKELELFDEVAKFKEYIDTLMPLILETWLEVSPNLKSDKNIDTVIGEDAALLLNHILSVMEMLWKIIKSLNVDSKTSANLFEQKYTDSFTEHFVQFIPYVTNIRSKYIKINDTLLENILTDPKLVTQNLKICHLFLMLNAQINMKKHHILVKSVLKYLEKMLMDNYESNHEELLMVLYNVFSEEVTDWTKNNMVTESLFKKIISIYFNKQLENNFKQQIFRLLCSIAINDKFKHLHSLEDFKLWLNDLPIILLQESIDNNTIHIIYKFAISNNKSYNKVMSKKLFKFIQNLPRICIADSSDDNLSYYKLFSLLYWIKSWDKDSLDLLEKQLLNNEYKSDHGKYIFDTLRVKSNICI